MVNDELKSQEEEIEKLSETFADETIHNQIESFEFDEPENFVEADFRDFETENAKQAEDSENSNKDAIIGEPITDPFDIFLSSIKGHQNVSIVITRLPDHSLEGQFRTPCLTRKKCENFYWNGESDSEEIYSYTAKTFGGGNYHFQIRRGKGFDKAWTQIINDPPELSKLEKTLRDYNKTNDSEKTNVRESSQEFVNKGNGSVSELVERINEINTLRDALTPPKTAQPQIVESNDSIKDRIVLSLLESGKGDKSLTEMIARSVFKITDKDEMKQDSWAEVGLHLVSNPKETLDFLGGLTAVFAPVIGNFFQKKQPEPSSTPAFQPVKQAHQEPPKSGLEKFRKSPETTEPINNTLPETPPIVTKSFSFIALED